MSLFEYRQSLSKPAWMDALLLDGEKPLLQYDEYKDSLRVRTSKRWVEIPIKKDLLLDLDFDIGGFIKRTWDEYWSRVDATSNNA